MQPANADALISEFGRTVGAPQLAFDPNGYCVLASGAVDLVLQKQTETAELLFAAVVAKLPDRSDAAFYARLLELNHARALHRNGTLGIDRTGGNVVFLDRCPLAALTLESLQLRIKSLIAAVESWREILEWSARNDAPDVGIATYEMLIRA